jgi:phosphoglucosamine mutase
VALEGRGRVLVRPSGTEQLVRVMVEAPSEDEADAVCERLVAIVVGAP